MNVVGTVAALFQTLAEHFDMKPIGSVKKAIQVLIIKVHSKKFCLKLPYKGYLSSESLLFSEPSDGCFN